MSDAPLNAVTLSRMTDDEIRAMFERIRWPDGVVCPHCGVVGESTKLKPREGATKSARPGTWKCRPCRKQFRVEVGTIFHSSHISLRQWLIAIHAMCASKKSVSALQLQRELGLKSYGSAWHLAHRIRLAMRQEPLLGMLAGHIEADEGYIGGKPRYGKPSRGHSRTTATKKIPVAVLVQRGGEAHALAMRKITAKGVRRFIETNVDRSASTLYADESKLYNIAGRSLAGGHEAVNHSIHEYARPGGIHRNTAGNFIGLFKRSVNGAWHHISEQHAQRFLDEATFRWGTRKLSDGERTVLALRATEGKQLMYSDSRNA